VRLLLAVLRWHTLWSREFNTKVHTSLNLFCTSSFVIPSYETITGGVASGSWPTVDARVTSDISGSVENEIAYEFVDAKGEKRVGNRFSFWFNDNDPVREHVLSHGRREGDSYVVTVRYDPANPNRSVVKPGVGNDLWFPIVLSVSMLLGCARVFRYSFTRFPTKKRRVPLR
jgi:hypothetical protein